VVALFALPPAIVAALIALLAGPIVAIVVLVVVAVALAAWARWAGPRRVLAAVDGHPPLVSGTDGSGLAQARFVNLVEGLCITAGVRRPALRVIEADGLNAIATGTRPDRAVLAVTSGLLRDLSRVELEAVLAEELALIRRDEILPGTVAAATFGVGRRLAVAADHDVAADLAAVTITRYPPGLVGALEKLQARGSAVPNAPAWTAPLWLADPGGSSAPYRMPLPERVAALEEL
jgi:heat shock protein HtpX